MNYHLIAEVNSQDELSRLKTEWLQKAKLYNLSPPDDQIKIETASLCTYFPDDQSYRTVWKFSISEKLLDASNPSN
jgi:hypothetical protein